MAYKISRLHISDLVTIATFAPGFEPELKFQKEELNFKCNS
jgi:hypothetical protein